MRAHRFSGVGESTQDPALSGLSDSEIGSMSGSGSRSRSTRPSAPVSASKSASRSKRGAAASKSAGAGKQPGARKSGPVKRVRKLVAVGSADAPAASVVLPVESTPEAVERTLRALQLAGSVSAKQAWRVAQVRDVARALAEAGPGDVAKVSRELSARMAELIAEANPSDDDDDWTAAPGAAAMGHPTQSWPRDVGP